MHPGRTIAFFPRPRNLTEVPSVESEISSDVEYKQGDVVCCSDRCAKFQPVFVVVVDDGWTIHCPKGQKLVALERRQKSVNAVPQLEWNMVNE